MTPNRQPHLIGVAECLPRLALGRAGSDPTTTTTLGQGVQASVVVLPHLVRCADCEAYLTDLSAVSEDLRQWATRVLVVVPSDASEVAGCTVLVDPDGAARARIGVADNDVAVIVADRYGAVYQVDAAGADHCLPAPAALVELAKFIDIQCPECGVPGAEWQLSCPLPLG
ncbi:MAG: hypothetical protein M3N98_00745 [Actinomycetota bacterium]|nr:hypothetical protein [Actinomycetota bacterium]